MTDNIIAVETDGFADIAFALASMLQRSHRAEERAEWKAENFYLIRDHGYIVAAQIDHGQQMERLHIRNGYHDVVSDLTEEAACLVLKAEGLEVGMIVMPTPKTVNFTIAGPMMTDGKGKHWRSTGEDWSGVMTLVEAVEMARRHRVELADAAARQEADEQRDADALADAIAAGLGFPGDWIYDMDGQDPGGPAIPDGYYSDPGEDPQWIADSLVIVE